MGEVEGVDWGPCVRWVGELRPLHPLPIVTVAARLQLPPSFPSFPSTVKSRPSQSSRRGHESLSAACSSPEPPSLPPLPPAGASDISPGTDSCCLTASHSGPEGFGAGPRPGFLVVLELVLGHSPDPETFRLAPPAMAPRPVSCMGSLLGPELVAAQSPSLVLRGLEAPTLRDVPLEDWTPKDIPLWDAAL